MSDEETAIYAAFYVVMLTIGISGIVIYTVNAIDGLADGVLHIILAVSVAITASCAYGLWRMFA